MGGFSRGSSSYYSETLCRQGMENSRLVSENARQIAVLVSEMSNLRAEVGRLAQCYADADKRLHAVEQTDNTSASMDLLKWKLITAASAIVGIISTIYGIAIRV